MVEVRAPDIFSKMAYDRAIVVFSPEGRLYQVEYAQKAVENAPTAVGVVYEAGVVLMAMKIYQKLLVPEAIEKIAKIEDHIGIVFCGMAGDARALIDYARLRAQIHRITYNEPISTKLLARQIANRKQQFTQIGGIRPYGVSFLIGGYNEGPELYETDPAGTVRKWYACPIVGVERAANEVSGGDGSLGWEGGRQFPWLQKP